jgi:hypothetical protein
MRGGDGAPLQAAIDRRARSGRGAHPWQPADLAQLQRAVGNAATASLAAGTRTRTLQRCSDGCDCCSSTGADGAVLQRQGLGGLPQLSGLASLDDLVPEDVRAVVPMVELVGVLARYGAGAIRTLVQLVRTFGEAIVHFIVAEVKCAWEVLMAPAEAIGRLFLFARSPAPDTGALLKPFLDVLCACLPDKLVLVLVEKLYMHGEPLAVAHLEHYLHGKGADFPEDLVAFLARDAKARQRLVDQINERGGEVGANGTAGFSGEAFIMQTDYSVAEYKNAWGNVCCNPPESGDEAGFIRFHVLDGPGDRAANAAAPGRARVRLEMRDHYKWHPAEQRPTQCLHQMLESLKAQGAKEYFQVGAATVELAIEPSMTPTP